MKKNVFALALVVVLISLLTFSSALAAKKNEPPGKSNGNQLNLYENDVAPAAGKYGQAGKSNIGHLYLYEKDPADWTIIEGGAWGKMKYNLSGNTFDFVFNGHELAIGQEYTLIYYPDPWPGTGLKILGIGTADALGDVHIKGEIGTGDLPIATDANTEGAKIWLVLSKDVGEGGMVGWTPTAYLFEYELITFVATP
ncbi:MAG: hypothetical protein ACYC5X_17100 [Syntrophales bacterium]